MEKIKNIIEILPKKLMKRVLGLFAVCGLSLAILSPSVCYAAADNSAQVAAEQQETFNVQMKSMINMLSQIVYVFLWPLLVIAGTALDNTLVYGKFLNLDAALWDIWNIMKNIANFALGFVFIFAIVKNLFKSSFGEGNPMQDAVKVVKSTLISGVLVQMSWFILGVLLDLSTILIYSVGGLPLSMLGAYDAGVANMPIMELHTNFDENNNGSFFYYYSYGSYNFSPCFVIDNESSSADFKLDGHKGKYIAGRKYLYLSGDTTFDTGYCVLYGYPYQYKESIGGFFKPDGGCTQEAPCYTKTGETLAAMNTSYYDQLKTYIKKIGTGGIEQEKANCFIISAYGSGCVVSDDTGTVYGAMSFSGDNIFKSAEGKLNSLLESSKGWVGPLVTMYSSILRVQELFVNAQDASTMSSLFGAIINTFFVVVLFIPIAILAILLIIRIGFLWVTIAISPILILINLGPDPINKLGKNKIFEKFTMKEVFMRIFSPIVVVFAVSLSIIFLATIHSLEPKHNQEFLNSLGIEENCEGNGSANNGGGEGAQGGEAGNPGNEGGSPEGTESATSPEDCRYTVSGLVDVKINLSGFNHGKDVFVWCLMMMLSTGIVRFFMKFAINIMGKGNIGETLMKSSEDFLKSIPIVPLPGGGAVGISKVGDIGLAKRLDSITTSLNGESETLLQERFPWAYPGGGKKTEDKTSEEVNAILNEVRTENKKYEDLQPEQQELITKYYGGNEAIATSIVNNIYNYTNNVEGVQTKIQNEITQEMKDGTHTSADALKLTDTQLDIAVQNDPTWKAWAEGMIGGAVHTQSGVRIVDVVKGTETTNPIYRIVTREQYEKNHFKAPVANVSEADYDQYRAEIKTYLDNMEKEMNDLQGKITAAGDSADPILKSRLEEMQGFFTGANSIEELRRKFSITSGTPTNAPANAPAGTPTDTSNNQQEGGEE